MSERRDEAAAILARLGLAADAVAAGAVPEAQLAELLAGPDGAALAAALGEFPTEAVGRLLATFAPHARDRATRKELRRALYRIRQRGVLVPEPPAAPAAAPRGADGAPEGFVTAFDGHGDRLIWLTRPLAGGETLLIAAQLNEPEGLRDLQVGTVSRKQLRAARQRLAADTGLRMVAADWRQLDALLIEGHERAAATDEKRDYLRVRPRLTSEPPLPAAEPGSSRAPAPSAQEIEALVAGSADLLGEPELRTWWPSSEAAAPFLEEMTAVHDSPLVLSRAQAEERLREILQRAARALYPPAVVARRLEGTAYVMGETGRSHAARLALAAAAALRERPQTGDETPLVAALVRRALGSLLATEQQQREEQRRSALVVTPGEALRARSSSRPPRTRS